MRETQKTIRRMSPVFARRAMAKHVSMMLKNGWHVTAEFEGDAGFLFECVTYFAK